MNILFLTMVNIKKLDDHGIYPDLLNEFVERGHKVFIASPAERRLGEQTKIKHYESYSVLRIKVGNLQKTNVIEKGISTVLLESQFLSAIKKYYADVKFDLVLYSTPPITFGKVINYVKKRDDAKTYLLLKDIFPQNAVDLDMFSKKSPFYKYFRAKEKQLYKQSDFIGCMSQANVDFVINNNSYIDKSKVHIAPNSIKLLNVEKFTEEQRNHIRKKYNIPVDKKVFVYGGNLGKPQGIPFLIKCLEANCDKEDRFFVISGTGTEYPKLKSYVDNKNSDNVLLINGLPKDEYEELVKACDVGLIFLDHRFTIPNFPSRILSYMNNSMPIVACTDVNTDVGTTIVNGDFGWWCESTDETVFTELIDSVIKEDLIQKGINARKYLEENYSVDKCCETILNNLYDFSLV